MSPTPSHTLATLLLSGLASCGALGAPARGDRDLPAGLLTGYAALAGGSSPSGSALWLTADRGGSLDRPSVVQLGPRRVLFATEHPQSAPSRIVRAAERTAGLLDFDAPAVAFEQAQTWERDGVRAPSAVAHRGRIVMAYESNGALGIATSTDGVTFVRTDMPILRADASHGEDLALGAPSLARAPNGTWWLAYHSGGKLFIAQSSSEFADQSWTRVGSGPLAEGAWVTPTGATTPARESLSEPSLLIERTPSGRTLCVLAATLTSAPTVPVTPTQLAGFAAYDCEGFVRSPLPLYVERGASVGGGAFDRISPRTLLLWVSRPDGSRRGIGALITPGGLRVGPPLG